MESVIVRIALLLLAGLLSTLVHAAPVELARFDRSVWPEQLDSPALFDVASRAEILSFARVLYDSEALSEAQLAERLNLRQVNLVTLNALRQRLWQRLWRNYDLAQQSCEQDASFCYAIDSLPDLRQQAGKFSVADDSFYAGWAQPSRRFHEYYLNEQLRKAALFTQTSSEVERFSDQEHDGQALNDRLFVLSFDGGPGPATEALTDYLRRQKLGGLFFVVGKNLQARRDQTSAAALQQLYAGQCVGLQGWQYSSHAQWTGWQDSVVSSRALVQSSLPEAFVPLFRPPYGQRRADSAAFFAGQQLQVMLWDIDAQDQAGLNAEQSAQRVLSLMLLWRRGVIQFHDGQPRAQAAIDWLLQHTAQSGIGWGNCREFAETP